MTADSVDSNHPTRTRSASPLPGQSPPAKAIADSGPEAGSPTGPVDSSTEPVRSPTGPAGSPAGPTAAGAAPAGPAPVAAAEVLAEQLAAAIAHREPGWRLPRRSALARKYDVGLDEIDAAIEALARKSLIRRLPDGQLFRASSAEYWIPVEGAVGLATRLDPMGNTINCQTQQVSRREAPQDVALALGLPTGAPVRVVRCVWTAADDPVAVSTAYRHESSSGNGNDSDQDARFPSFGSALNTLPPAAVSLEISPSQPTVARTLRLTAGHPVITVTIRFDHAPAPAPAGLTVVMLKPELFRVAIDITRAQGARFALRTLIYAQCALRTVCLA